MSSLPERFVLGSIDTDHGVHGMSAAGAYLSYRHFGALKPAMATATWACAPRWLVHAPAVYHGPARNGHVDRTRATGRQNYFG